jgi:hypothetical protein
MNGSTYIYCELDYYDSCRDIGHFSVESDHAVVAIVFASVSLLTAIGDIVNTYLNRYNLKEKLSSIFKIVVSVLLVILTGILV